MPETATPTPKVEPSAPAPKSPAAPDVAAPDLAPEPAVQAVVESFRQAGTAGVSGSAGFDSFPCTPPFRAQVTISGPRPPRTCSIHS